MFILRFWEQGVEITVGVILALILAFAYHEFAHAVVADYLGDPTPRQHGRMTLNPFPHLSPTGLVMLLLLGFGWATTPVRPNLLRGNTRISMAWVAVAGPFANLVMAGLFAVPLRLFQTGILTYPEGFPWVLQVLWWGAYLNVLLLVFNLLPIPPLDGFTILLGFLPPQLGNQLAPLRQYGTIIIIGVLFLLPRAGIDVWGLVLDPAITQIMALLIGA